MYSFLADNCHSFVAHFLQEYGYKAPCALRWNMFTLVRSSAAMLQVLVTLRLFQYRVGL
jgi:hypothetical protein